jgi:hypothetical protein
LGEVGVAVVVVAWVQEGFAAAWLLPTMSAAVLPAPAPAPVPALVHSLQSLVAVGYELGVVPSQKAAAAVPCLVPPSAALSALSLARSPVLDP